MQSAAQGRILADQTLRANTDSPIAARLFYVVLNTDVPPLNDVHCRRAVLYAADRVAYQRANGGETGGEIATNLLPPVIPGAVRFDLYPSADGTGDLDRARNELSACGAPTGFATHISYRAEVPRERATAEALQQSLGRVGIRLELAPFPLADYYSLYAGKPDHARDNDLGLMLAGWSADWPDGYGFLAQIVDSRTIRPSGGNANLGIKDPRVDMLLDEAVRTTDLVVREQRWVDIDRLVMEEARVLPGVWAKGLFYRPPHLTNMFITNGYQMYDYLAIGTTRR